MFALIKKKTKIRKSTFHKIIAQFTGRMSNAVRLFKFSNLCLQVSKQKQYLMLDK